MRNSTLIDEERSVALLKGIWTLFACKLSEPQKQATHRKDVDLLWITCRRDNVPVVLGNVILYGHNISYVRCQEARQQLAHYRTSAR
jgi:hypothetical protein